jgi:hypothetical protein
MTTHVWAEQEPPGEPRETPWTQPTPEPAIPPAPGEPPGDPREAPWTEPPDEPDGVERAPIHDVQSEPPGEPREKPWASGARLFGRLRRSR